MHISRMHRPKFHTWKTRKIYVIVVWHGPKGAPNHLRRTSIYLGSAPFGHDPKLIPMGKVRNIDCNTDPWWFSLQLKVCIKTHVLLRDYYNSKRGMEEWMSKWDRNICVNMYLWSGWSVPAGLHQWRPGSGPWWGAGSQTLPGSGWPNLCISATGQQICEKKRQRGQLVCQTLKYSDYCSLVKTQQHKMSKHRQKEVPMNCCELMMKGGYCPYGKDCFRNIPWSVSLLDKKCNHPAKSCCSKLHL